MTAHAAILQAIAIVQEAQRANSIEHPVELLGFHWNHGCQAVARECLDKLHALAEEIEHKPHLKIVDGMAR